MTMEIICPLSCYQCPLDNQSRSMSAPVLCNPISNHDTVGMTQIVYVLYRYGPSHICLGIKLVRASGIQHEWLSTPTKGWLLLG